MRQDDTYEFIGEWDEQYKRVGFEADFEGRPIERLIRCKDCKHWDGDFCHNEWWGDGYGNYTPPIKTEDGFCDWAERKEE